ncbi:hypothetical protein FRC11_008907 [Ceratobasidium sp. 423]|nr:hypothetical protein FRC11_008907 [Ceratobasidium sp. 423]
MSEINPRRSTTTSGNNNLNAHLPEQAQDLDILAPTSLKNFQDKDALLRNIGLLCGIRVDDNDGPQSLMRRVTKYVGVEPPFVEEICDFLTETITTKSERGTNYIHSGWSIDAASTVNPWILSRIAANNQRNEDGTWLTRRTLIQRFRVRVSPEDLVPVPGFKAEIESALKKPSIFQRFEAVYRVLRDWSVISYAMQVWTFNRTTDLAGEFEMGVSWVLTDLESNMSQLPAVATWTDAHHLTTVRTARTTRQVGVISISKNDTKTHHRSNVRTVRIVYTGKMAYGLKRLLYFQRLSYIPVVIIGPDETYSSVGRRDDTPQASRKVSSVIVDDSPFMRSVACVYLDKGSLSRQEISEMNIFGGEFVLAEGEYITEMLIWRDDGVVEGLQFVTNLGRCSRHFGRSSGTPTVARSKGGVLVGVVSADRSGGYVTRVAILQGIWRHDVVEKVPKEDDVFSDYFGSKDKGRPFNDRVVVRNSDMAISKIDVGCGAIIDSLKLTYIDNSGQGCNEYQTERHGGPGGGKGQFVLEAGEHITSVSGKYTDERIIQLSFVTNKGRTSEVFAQGKSPGESHSFSVSSPKDQGGKRMRLQYICGKW